MLHDHHPPPANDDDARFRKKSAKLNDIMRRVKLATAREEQCTENPRDETNQCFTCPVSLGCLGDATVSVDRQCYSVSSLVSWFRERIFKGQKPTIPHNRRALDLDVADAFLTQHDHARLATYVHVLYRAYGYDAIDRPYDLVKRALEKRDHRLLRYIIDAKPVVLGALERDDDDEWSISHVVAYYGPPQDIERAIVHAAWRADGDDRTYDDEQATPMHMAAVKGHVRLMALLNQLDADCNALDAYGQTPVMWAARDGRTAAVRWLIRAGARLEHTDENGDTVVHHCCNSPDTPNRTAMLGVLLRTCPTAFTRQNNEGHTVLNIAVHNAMYDVVRWLVPVYNRVLSIPKGLIVHVLDTTDADGQTIRDQAVEDGDERAFIDWLDAWRSTHE